ncbi:MAG: hypothetical protein AAF290_16090 [Pseudomonadota bacterium]
MDNTQRHSKLGELLPELVIRYGLTLLGLIAVTGAIGFISDLVLEPLLTPSNFLMSAAEADAWQQRTLMILNIQSCITYFFGFATGAYLLRHNPYLVGIIVHISLSLVVIKILRDVALPADPTTAYWDIIAHNPAGWIGGLAAALLGMWVGHRLARRFSTGNVAPGSGAS